MYQSEKPDGEKPSHTEVLDKLLAYSEMDNIADELGEDQLKNIGITVVQEYEIDEQSRDDWVTTARKGLEVAKQAKKEKKTYPFNGAADVNFPLLLVAALQFNARAYPALIDPAGIVKASVVGQDDEKGSKKATADRISKHMSWQLIEQMTEWEDDTDTMFMQLPIVGAAFRKSFWDKKENRPKSVMVPGVDLVVNQSARDINSVPRITHINELYPHEIKEEQRAKRFCECEIQPAQTADNDTDAPHDVLEQHRLLDLDKDGYAEPYIVTVHKESNQVLRIQANYAFDEIEEMDGQVIRIPRRAYFTKYTFIPDPEGGFYGMGYAHLIEKLGSAIDTTINQMLDAGHLQNAGGGFIGSGLRLKKATYRMEPGVYHSVKATGTTLKDSIVNMQHPGPSPVLFSMLDLLINAAQDITSVKDILTGDTGDKVQTATTTLALIEQGMKVFTAIHKRIFRSFKDEFKLLFRLNAEGLPDESYFNVMDTPTAVAKTDYDVEAFDVIPQADPRLVTDAQRLARAQLIFEISKDNPHINPVEALKRFLLAAGVPEIESLLVEQLPPNPMEALAAEDAQAEIKNKNADTVAKISKAERDAKEGDAKEAEVIMNMISGPQESAA